MGSVSAARESIGEEFTAKEGKASSPFDVEGNPLGREVEWWEKWAELESAAVGEWSISVRGDENGRPMWFNEYENGEVLEIGTRSKTVEKL